MGLLDSIKKDRDQQVKIYLDNEELIASRSDLQDDIKNSFDATTYFNSTPAQKGGVKVVPNVTVVNSTALIEASKFSSAMILNFASAVHAGGGYIRGANAQEECLCRSSGLYNILKQFKTHYDYHRSLDGTLYTDAMMYHPNVPFFRDDYGFEIPKRYFDVLTAAMPNNRTKYPVLILKELINRRIQKVFAIAAQKNQRNLILGAWGCGAFYNDPELVASLFAANIKTSGWQFDNIVFAVLDNDDEKLVSVFRKHIIGE